VRGNAGGLDARSGLLGGDGATPRCRAISPVIPLYNGLMDAGTIARPAAGRTSALPLHRELRQSRPAPISPRLRITHRVRDQRGQLIQAVNSVRQIGATPPY
jgi:hypothetical protein